MGNCDHASSVLQLVWSSLKWQMLTHTKTFSWHRKLHVYLLHADYTWEQAGNYWTDLITLGSVGVRFQTTSLLEGPLCMLWESVSRHNSCFMELVFIYSSHYPLMKPLLLSLLGYLMEPRQSQISYPPALWCNLLLLQLLQPRADKAAWLSSCFPWSLPNKHSGVTVFRGGKTSRINRNSPRLPPLLQASPAVAHGVFMTPQYPTQTGALAWLSFFT